MVMIIEVPYFGKFSLWKIKDEKDALVGFPEKEDISNQVDFLFKTLVKQDRELHYKEKLYILIYIHALGISNTKSLMPFTCPHCGNVTDGDINVMNSLKFEPFDKKKLRKNGYEITFSAGDKLFDRITNIKKDRVLTKEEILMLFDDLDIEYVNFMDLYSKDLNGFFDFIGIVNCLMCNGEISTNKVEDELLERYILSSNVIEYYETLIYLKLKLGVSIEEYDNMYPFEREILVSKIQELNKNE